MQFAITHVRVEAKLMAESGEKIILVMSEVFEIHEIDIGYVLLWSVKMTMHSSCRLLVEPQSFQSLSFFSPLVDAMRC